MNNSSTSISVIITCHNEAKYIEQCVKSVFKQTIFHLVNEIIVINDNSSDNSQEILESLKNNCSVLKVIKSNNKSLSKSRNQALKLSSGKYIAILDGDDFWENSKLEIQFEKIKKLDERYALIYTNFIHFKNDDLENICKVSVKSHNKNYNNQLIEYFCKDAPLVPSTIFFKSEILKDIGYFDENLRYYEDTDFYLRILEKYKVFHIPDFLCFKRQHQNQITHKLYKTIPDSDLVIFKFIERNKNLKNLKKIRMSRNRNKAALHTLRNFDERKIVFKLIYESLKYNPINLKTWSILFITLLPKRIIIIIINILKKLRILISLRIKN